MRESKQTTFPARTPAPAIRRRSSQVFSAGRWFGPLGLALFVISSWTSHATQMVTLAWNANPEPDIVGYRLYYRTADGSSSEAIDVGNTTVFTVLNLIDGITYFFRVTAYNDASLESQPSNEVSYPPRIAAGSTILTVENGTGGGSYAAGTLVIVNANAPPEGSQFVRWIGDTPILSNPAVSPTTATIPSFDVTVTATYSGSN